MSQSYEYDARVLVVLAIAALAILACVVVVSLGKGGELAEFPPDIAPLNLPESQQVTAVDVMALRLPVNLVGYHTQSVDETLRRAATAISLRDTRIAVLEQRVAELLANRLQARQELHAGPGQGPLTDHRPRPPGHPVELSPNGDQPHAEPGPTVEPGPIVEPGPTVESVFDVAARAIQARDLQAREAEVRELQAREAEVRELQVREAEVRELQVREIQAYEVQVHEVQAHEAEVRGAEVRGAELRGAEVREMRAREIQGREDGARRTAERVESGAELVAGGEATSGDAGSDADEPSRPVER